MEAVLEATKGQMDGFLSRLVCKRYLEEEASVGGDVRFALNSTPGWCKHAVSGQMRSAGLKAEALPRITLVEDRTADVLPDPTLESN